MTDQRIRCVRIETDGTYIVGPLAELHTLLDSVLPHEDDIEDSETVTLTFPLMTLAELDALPEFEG
ncbi:hypothetical protein SAMN04487785_102430 [Dyella jiangningensis]|uniref:hypothetical protein n=1 Tax=Dyella sp. AtDHG13 TaxID=1938897 RepID=UPI00088D4804|nr:hypothetical protein [Dyella sp. AtDHG13]PXV60702.1 hypothetical protein BDW41_102429 [Dyella sp. AtDHG13]SDJ55744.1 hypothetical protein SAMN04487785_102430 [Dyella jiangningensis]